MSDKEVVLTVTLREYDTIQAALYYFGHPGDEQAILRALDIAAAHTGAYLSDCNSTSEYSNFVRKIDAQFEHQLAAANREIGVGAQVGTAPEPVNC